LSYCSGRAFAREFIVPRPEGARVNLLTRRGVVGVLVGQLLDTEVFEFGDIPAFALRSIAIAVNGALR
jgi:hypothetical protein